MDYAFLTDFARRGALLDLTPFAESKELRTEDHDQSMITAGSIDDKLYAITLGVNAPGVIYDATVFQELGIEEPQESWTWKDFGDIATKIAAAKGDGFYGSADISGTTNMFEVFIRQSGKGLFDGGTMTATSEELQQWFDMWGALRENGGVTTAEITASTTNALETRPISLGTAAMDFAWSNQLLTFQQVNKNQDHKLGIQVLPHGVNEQQIGEYLKPGQFLSGYGKTKHPKEVAMFIDFMVNDPEATAILGSERGVRLTQAFVSRCSQRCRKRSKSFSNLSIPYRSIPVRSIHHTRKDLLKWTQVSRAQASRLPSVKAILQMSLPSLLKEPRLHLDQVNNDWNCLRLLILRGGCEDEHITGQSSPNRACSCPAGQTEICA